jgi:hypothetical protein
LLEDGDRFEILLQVVADESEEEKAALGAGLGVELEVPELVEGTELRLPKEEDRARGQGTNPGAGVVDRAEESVLGYREGPRARGCWFLGAAGAALEVRAEAAQAEDPGLEEKAESTRVSGFEAVKVLREEGKEGGIGIPLRGKLENELGAETCIGEARQVLAKPGEGVLELARVNSHQAGGGPFHVSHLYQGKRLKGVDEPFLAPPSPLGDPSELSLAERKEGDQAVGLALIPGAQDDRLRMAGPHGLSPAAPLRPPSSIYPSIMYFKNRVEMER